MSISLTEMERKVFPAIAQVNFAGTGASNFEEFALDRCITCDVKDVAKVTGLDSKSIRGVISSLIQKGLVYIDEYDANFKVQWFYDMTDLGEEVYNEMFASV